MRRFWYGILVGTMICLAASVQAAKTPDERPRRSNEWGFRPAAGETLQVTPPGFSWRPQKGAKRYALQCARDAAFRDIGYSASDVTFNVHCPPMVFDAGRWFWRFRFYDGNDWSAWSSTRSFVISASATKMPLPKKADLIARIPKTHPRLFVRPEWMADLRTRARGDLKPIYDRLVRECDKLVAQPPPTAEPPTYPDSLKRGSDPWRKIWWGNRRYTQRVLNGAATLAFTYLLDGNEQYGQLARKLLMACAEWDPKGATGYRYNDEAGMPYNYYFSRTYTFLYDLLNEAERAKCREVMAIRGKEMYRHLYPRHLWRPYSSHSNRAWHFLGEIGIAFLGEIPEAEDWVWFAANVFMNVYPVWGDSDGGWHEGNAYWNSYLNRFTWWADVMKAALEIDAYQKPFFSKVGYYPMYLMPPGTKGGGFGDLTARRDSEDNASLMRVFAAQAQNPYWKWYVDVHDREYHPRGYVDFVRGALPRVEPKAPADLPSSRVFRGIGQAMLNADLLNAKDNVSAIFKSSPFGSQSHGYESQNAFLIYAFGERLFIRTGRRDSYGSKHHREWMWHTKSVNSITVNGKGQGKRSALAVGKIVDFATTEHIDWVVGEAGEAYGDQLDRFTRSILFVKPEIILVYDVLEAPEASSFEWRLHAPVEMAVNGQADIRVVNGGAACQVTFLWPEGLDVTQTDKFDTPPRPRIKLVEYHLTAQTKEKRERQAFITVFRPHRAEIPLRGEPVLKRANDAFEIRVPIAGGEALVKIQETGIDAAVLDRSGGIVAEFSRGF